MSGIAATGFEDVVRCLQRFADGADGDMDGRPDGLLRRVRDRLDRSDAPAWKAAAFGVAR